MVKQGNKLNKILNELRITEICFNLLLIKNVFLVPDCILIFIAHKKESKPSIKSLKSFQLLE